jgi:acyl dehydratase
MNGGQADTFGVPIRPGDVITARTRLASWEERTGRNGLTLFTYTETEWRNQNGELVKTRISTGIRY